MSDKLKAVIITNKNQTDYKNLIEIFPPNVKLINDEEKADIYIFANRYDIPPQLYGEHRTYKKTNANWVDHILGVYYYTKAKNKGLPVIGFEGGAHFVNALNGGTTFQHVYGHEDYHTMFASTSVCTMEVPSDHHQLMNPYVLPNDAFTVIACSYDICGEFYNGEGDSIQLPQGFGEPEVIYYHKTNDLAIQADPTEKGKIFETSRKFFKQLMVDYLDNTMEEYYDMSGKDVD